MKLLLATANRGKVAEMQRILVPMGMDILTPDQIGISTDIEETGSTFCENAMIKAKYLHDLTGYPTIADDSGLCVEALDGSPGVLTARFGGDCSNSEKIQRLLAQMTHIPKEMRTAYFECCICCILDNDRTLQATGRCTGWIGLQPAGSDGFGFDPIFYVGDRSFAQLTPAEKDAISHRGIALRKMQSQLAQILGLAETDNANKETL